MARETGEASKGEAAGRRPAIDSRILQANERTMLAWVRTSVTLMGFGFVVARLTLSGGPGGVVEPGEASRGGLAIGLGLVALGVLCNFVAARRFLDVRRALVEGAPVEPDVRSILSLAVSVALIGVVLAAGLVFG